MDNMEIVKMELMQMAHNHELITEYSKIFTDYEKHEYCYLSISLLKLQTEFLRKINREGV